MPTSLPTTSPTTMPCVTGDAAASAIESELITTPAFASAKTGTIT